MISSSGQKTQKKKDLTWLLFSLLHNPFMGFRDNFRSAEGHGRQIKSLESLLSQDLFHASYTMVLFFESHGAWWQNDKLRQASVFKSYLPHALYPDKKQPQKDICSNIQLVAWLPRDAQDKKIPPREEPVHWLSNNEGSLSCLLLSCFRMPLGLHLDFVLCFFLFLSSFV